MKKYDKSTVFDYLLGNDIVGYNIDELEENPEFMAEVVTRDNKAYDLCSENIRSSYVFVKFILDHNPSNLNLCMLVADTYLDKDIDDDIESINQLAISILMKEIVRNYDPQLELKYGFHPMLAYKEQHINGFAIVDSIDDEIDKENAGLGFIFVDGKLMDNEIVANYIADRYVDDLDDEGLNLEEELHCLLRKKDQIKKEGLIKTTVIQIINRYDITLAQYVAKNINKLPVLNRKIKKIIKRWDAYNFHIESINEECNECQEFNYYKIYRKSKYFVKKYPSKLDLRTILIYLSDEYGIGEEINNILNTYEPRMLEDYDGNMFQDERTFDEEYEEANRIVYNYSESMPELSILRKIKQVIEYELGMIGEDDLDEVYNYDDESEIELISYKRKNEKVLKFKPRKEDK